MHRTALHCYTALGAYGGGSVLVLICIWRNRRLTWIFRFEMSNNTTVPQLYDIENIRSFSFSYFIFSMFEQSNLAVRTIISVKKNISWICEKRNARFFVSSLLSYYFKLIYVNTVQPWELEIKSDLILISEFF